MNKSVRNYLLGSIAAYVVVMLVVISTAEDKASEKAEAKEVPVVVTTAPRIIPVSTFPKKATTNKIPNPCEVIDLDTVKSFMTGSIAERGPIVQDSIAPSKLCEWTTEKADFPRLGISIVLSKTFFDASESLKDSNLKVGDKAFSRNEYVTGFGGATCGKTAIVKSGDYSFAVALCKAEDEKPTNAELVSLAEVVEKALP